MINASGRRQKDGMGHNRRTCGTHHQTHRVVMRLRASRADQAWSRLRDQARQNAMGAVMAG